MQFLLALSLIAGASASFEFNNIAADSQIGMNLLSKARQLEQQDQEFDNTWVAGYSIKFQGCHHVSQWNDEANDEEDVRISTKRLVRFRLCPSDTCTAESGKGCSSGYGDYIVDMDTFLNSYFQAKQTYQEFQCDYLQNYVCGCDDNDNGNNNNNNGNYNEEMCLYDCYTAHNMEDICADNNPYYDDQQAQENMFDVAEYMQCNKVNFENNNNGNNRKLDEWNGEYYVGPYCASQGGSIYLGVFTDDSCTSFADDNGGVALYYQYTGEDLPYASANIVDMDCLSCMEPQDNNNDGNDAEDDDQVSEVCENVYEYAGKCEGNLPQGTVYYPNNNACNYMEGIKIVRKDGTVVTNEASANKTASVFIGVFVVAFVLLSAYVYYLKTKLDRASINLSD